MHIKPLDGISQQKIAFDVKTIIKIFGSIPSFVSLEECRYPLHRVAVNMNDPMSERTGDLGAL